MWGRLRVGLQLKFVAVKEETEGNPRDGDGNMSMYQEEWRKLFFCPKAVSTHSYPLAIGNCKRCFPPLLGS